MNFNEYQKKAQTTAFHPPKYKIIYPALGLGSEAGEVLGKIKKWLRGDYGRKGIDHEHKEMLKEELGDVLWYLAILAYELEINLDDVANSNVKKLQDRKKRNKLKGDGDRR